MIQHLRGTKDQGFVLLEIVLVVMVVGLAGGAVYMGVRNASKANHPGVGSVAHSATPKPSPTPTPAASPTPAPTAAPTATPAAPAKTATPRPATPVPVVHPTQANCTAQTFTAYVSNPAGTQSYWSLSNMSLAHTYAYKTKLSVTCNSGTPAGWAIYLDDYVRFSDLSLNAL